MDTKDKEQNKENGKYKVPEVGAYFTAKSIARRPMSWRRVSKGRLAGDEIKKPVSIFYKCIYKYRKCILELLLDHGKGFGFALSEMESHWKV